MKITIIGAGNIGGAIARGLAKGHMFKASDITCTAQSDTTLEKMRNTNPDFVLSLDNVEAVKGADIIVIAVKPWRVEEIIDQIKGILDYDKQIIVSVADTGVGIKESDLAKVKTKFYKANHTRRGSGIGLAVADEIVTMHGGSMDIASEGEGLGTTVTITLPTVDSTKTQ